jgi:hypothetical protein
MRRTNERTNAKGECALLHHTSEADRQLAANPLHYMTSNNRKLDFGIRTSSFVLSLEPFARRFLRANHNSQQLVGFADQTCQLIGFLQGRRNPQHVVHIAEHFEPEERFVCFLLDGAEFGDEFGPGSGPACGPIVGRDGAARSQDLAMHMLCLRALRELCRKHKRVQRKFARPPLQFIAHPKKNRSTNADCRIKRPRGQVLAKICHFKRALE